MKKVIFIISCIFLCTAISAQSAAPVITPAQVAQSAYIPYGGTVLSLGTYGMLPEEMQMPYLTALNYVWMTPAFMLCPDKAVPQAGISLAFETASFLCSGLGWNVPSSLNDALWNIGWKLNYWTQYEGYAAARSRCESGLYPDFKAVSFKDAVTAPFTWDVLKRPEVAYPILGLAAGYTLIELLSGTDNAIWNTGTAYIGDKEVVPALGIAYTALVSIASYTATGIGEEALFRGIGYEEMKQTMGRLPATLIDSAGFAAVHVPQELLAGMNTSTVLSNFLLRAASSVISECIYETGGLTSSIAVHAWTDIIVDMMVYLFTSGNPQTEATTANIAPAKKSGVPAMNVNIVPYPTISFTFRW